ncbi:hypothetical protein [Pseudomonas sp. UFMG81]|uniref:hypothetical protein n=1 Tax=Pseudomonas sp. UFMG81 TaxID=2745936 RepID=UPI00189030B3|nr:hypothetical protein [Pseudomonas sp. UFMG81]
MFVTKEQIAIAKELWELARDACVVAHCNWGLLEGSKASIIQSLRDHGTRPLAAEEAFKLFREERLDAYHKLLLVKDERAQELAELERRYQQQ